MNLPGRVLLTTALGGVLGALCDQIHVRFGVLAYPQTSPQLFDQAIWVAPLFATATLVILFGAIPFVRGGLGSADSIGGAFSWFLLAYLASGVFGGYPLGLAIGYVLFFLARVLPRADRGPLLGMALALALLGPLFETGLSATGAFFYTHPDLGLVPLWLPAFYLMLAPLALVVARHVFGRDGLAPH